jgi:hypothetical protein
MPLTIVDGMDAAGPWQAFAPDGVTPSTELSLRIVAAKPRPGGDPSSARISASAKAQNHVLRRALPGLDLTNFDELRLWLTSDRIADGTATRPFFLELRLGSAAIGLGNPANTWQRYLPISQARTWEPVRLSIGDLAAGIRSAISAVQIRSVQAAPFDCNVDDIVAVREAMIGDVDAALLGLLDGILVVNGVKVPAVLHPADATQARPYIGILQYDTAFSRDRTDSASPRGDFTDNGYVLRPQSNGYELFYQVTAIANDRAAQTQILEFILRTLTPRGQLMVNDLPLPMEAVFVTPIDQIGGHRTDQIPLFYKISTRQEVGSGTVVTAAKTTIVSTDFMALQMTGS